MNNDNEVKIIITAKDKASSVISSASEAIKSDFKKLGNFVKEHWASIAASMAVVTSIITATFYKVTQAAMEAEDAETRLTVAMQNQGTYTAKAQDELIKYADARQRASKFDDEAIIIAMANLQTYGMTTAQVKIATQAALDLAAAKRMDLVTASELVGKAFIGETQTLSRYGFVLNDNLSKGEKFAAVLQQITARFGGSAQAEANTFIGKLQILKNMVGNLSEALGMAIIESDGAKDSLSRVTDIIEKLTSFIEEHQTAVKITAIAAGFVALTGSITTLTAVLIKAWPLLTALGLITAGTWGLTAGAGVGIGVGLGYLIDRLTGFNDDLRQVNQMFRETQAEQRRLDEILEKKRGIQGQGKTGQSINYAQQAIDKIKAKYETEEALKNLSQAERRQDELELYGMHMLTATPGRRFLSLAWDTNVIIPETQTKLEKFYDWFEARSREAAQAAQSNFSNYFFNLFTGQIRTLEDAWMGFLNAIFNAWARTMADMAAQSMASKLFGLGLQTASMGFINAAPGGMATSTEAIKSYPGLGGIPSGARRLSGGTIINNNTLNINYPHDGDSVKRMLAREGETIAALAFGNYKNRGIARTMVQNGG